MAARIVAGGATPEGAEGSQTTRRRHRRRLQLNEELTHRLMFLMVNEAARCVEEGVVDSPEDADYGMILGTGFAPFRGGPLRFAEHFGLKGPSRNWNGWPELKRNLLHAKF